MLTILYEIHDIRRFPTARDFLSYAKLVKCDHRSGRRKLGTGGAEIGNGRLKWVFSEAASLFPKEKPKPEITEDDALTTNAALQTKRSRNAFAY